MIHTYDEVNKYRTELLGIAALMVFLNHSKQFLWDDKFGVILKLFSEGGMGVDVFILLSGIGLYYSFSNNKEILSFYKRRVIRIIPTYLSIAVIFFVIKSAVVGSFKGILLDLSLLSYWVSGNNPYWYVAYALVLYLFYPFIYIFLLKSRTKTTITIVLMYLIQILILIYANDLYCRLQLFLSRLPITIIACWLGKQSYEKKSINNKTLIIFLLLFTVIRMLRIVFIPEIYEGWVTFFVKTANGFFVIVFIYLFAVLMRKIDANLIDKQRLFREFLSKILCFFGNLSLEIYLIHMSIVSCVFWLCGTDVHVGWYFLIVFPATCLLSYIDKKIVGRLNF